MCVRTLGETHNTTHFQDSFLYKVFLEKSILQEPTIQLGPQLVQPYIMGDFAYSLMMHIMKVFFLSMQW